MQAGPWISGNVAEWQRSAVMRGCSGTPAWRDASRHGSSIRVREHADANKGHLAAGPRRVAMGAVDEEAVRLSGPTRTPCGGRSRKPPLSARSRPISVPAPGFDCADRADAPVGIDLGINRSGSGVRSSRLLSPFCCCRLTDVPAPVLHLSGDDRNPALAAV